jgi:hypothetical protein
MPLVVFRELWRQGHLKQVLDRKKKTYSLLGRLGNPSTMSELIFLATTLFTTNYVCKKWNENSPIIDGARQPL